MESVVARIAVPFRMQPALQRLGPGARHLRPLAAGFGATPTLPWLAPSRERLQARLAEQAG